MGPIRIAVAAAAVALATSCGSGDPDVRAPSAATAGPATGAEQDSTAESSTAPTEGPAGEGPHEWPDGITAEVVAVEAAAAVAPDDPALDTEVRVTTRFTNTGSQTFAFPADPNTIDSGPPDDLLYGVDRYVAQGWFNDTNNLPTQLAAGSSADWVSVFTLPGSELQQLAFVIAPTREHEAYIFTEVETLLP